MSVVGNWIHETKRFAPGLRVLVHHGLERLQGADLTRAASQADLVITTYALAHRDRDDLAAVEWWRVCLDEAQNIKNPSAKQTQAIRNIPAPRRIALTGTPVENRLGELWSIMDFLNRGYLGPASEFRSKFAMPIERFHDQHRSGQLRGLIQPFILRRLKSDRTVIADLPEKIETKEYCYLTPEQAQLYRTCVSDMLAAAEKSEGIQRRGVVLAGLIKLKQICNHPAQFFKEFAGTGGDDAGPPSAERSGKCLRMIEMLTEIVEGGDRALVFTQFRQMGTLLAAMLRHHLDREVLFLHGGTPAAQRQSMIRRFQGEDGGGDAPVLILSLKAGGLGLNLTAANHVFHFDRWWNPAVEAQATDRAYRIGQTRSVQVHKFIVSGTLEERIDAMIEQKTMLAEQVIGSGERWLTELSTSQLRDLLILRPEAVGEASSAASISVTAGLSGDAK
jgi:SNF2 family DNA or RNA helicase